MHSEKKATFDLLRDLSAKNDHQLAVLADIQGPKIRTGDMEKAFDLDVGDVVRVTSEEVTGTKQRFTIRYPGDLIGDLDKGDKIFINDGIVRLTVKEKDGKDLVCEVEAPGTVSNKKGCNMPSGSLSVAFPTPKDAEDLEFICTKLRPDWIAVSFVGKVEDMRAIRACCEKHGFPEAKVRGVFLFCKNVV